MDLKKRALVGEMNMLTNAIFHNLPKCDYLNMQEITVFLPYRFSINVPAEDMKAVNFLCKPSQFADTVKFLQFFKWMPKKVSKDNVVFISGWLPYYFQRWL